MDQSTLHNDSSGKDSSGNDSSGNDSSGKDSSGNELIGRIKLCHRVLAELPAWVMHCNGDTLSLFRLEVMRTNAFNMIHTLERQLSTLTVLNY
jgi:hypothetical protein